MPALSTAPVYFCRGGCGRLVEVAFANAVNDEAFDLILGNLHKLAICDECKSIRNYRVLVPGAVPFYLNPDIRNDDYVRIEQIAGDIDLERWRQQDPEYEAPIPAGGFYRSA